MKRKIEDICWKEIVWHRPFTLDNVYELLVHLATTLPRGALIWEVRGLNGCVRYCLGAERKYIANIAKVLRSHGKIQLYNLPEHARATVSTAAQIKISHPVLSLKTDIALSAIRAGLAAIALPDSKGETVLQVVLGPSYAPSVVPKHMNDPHSSWLQVILGNAEQAPSEVRNSARDKAQQHGFCAAIRIGVSGEGNKGRIYDVFSALKTLESAGVRISLEAEKGKSINSAYAPWHFPLRLSAKELAHFLLLPAGEEELAGIAGLHPKAMPSPEWYKCPSISAQTRIFAHSCDTAEKVNLSISPKDGLEHTILLGPTGTGKSTCMLHMALADIHAGRSVLVIDPKTDLVNELLARIPESRKDDVVVIDPSDNCPVGFNPLSFTKYQSHSLIADAVLAVFKDIFAENWGIRSQDVLSAALLTLAQVKDASLLYIPTLLTDEAFRHRITNNLKDKLVLQPFWEGFDAMREAERRQEIAPVMNKMRQFLLRPGLRNVLGQSEPRFSLADLFYKRRIVLVPLNKGIIGAESARLLGSLIVGLTWTLSLARAGVPPERRHIVSIHIDELQDYVSLPTDLADALAQARSLGLGLCMAHQYRGQLTPGIRAGIDANARNKIIFGLNTADAKDMAAMAPELAAQDFMALPRYHVYASFQQAGRNTGWVQGKTLPLPTALHSAAELKAHSMQRFGKPAEDVEKELMQILQKDKIHEDQWSDVLIGRRKLP